MKKTLFILIVISLALPGQLAAVEPARAGEYVHETFKTPHPYPSSGSDHAMLSWADEVIYPGATYIALHFASFELAEGDSVIVRSPDGTQSWTYTSRGRHDLGGRDGGFFATHIRGDTAIVELFTVGDESAFGYHIDYFGRGYNEFEIEMFWGQGLGEKMNIPAPPGLSESICTQDDTREAKCYQSSDPDAYDTSRAVARLLLSGSAHCTGWLIGDAGHLMTNEHCISSQSTLNNIDFEFMAEGPDCATDCSSSLACPGITEASGGSFITDDNALDYALVIPDTSTANNTDLPATYGFMRLRQGGAALNERIYHPQHPAGWGKRIGMESSYPEDVAMGGFCYASSLNEVACSGGPGDVGYWTDTQGGSSGSPVLGYSDNKIVALHHCRGSAFCSSGNPAVDDRNRGVPVDPIIADLGDDMPPGALCDAFDGPLTLSATAAGDNRIDLAWDVVSGADISYRVWRAVGSCPQSDYELIAGDLAATNYSDAEVSGGTTYAYVVTAVENTNGCESELSPCDDAPATGLCIWDPDFNGLELVTNQQSSNCAIALDWSDATLHCGDAVVYNVYRSETGGFTPDSDTLVAFCLNQTEYVDSGVTSGVEYFYVVRAEDNSGNGSGACANGNEEDNSVELSGLATGPDTLVLTDDMESGPGNWTTDGTGGSPWTMVTTSSHSPSHSWFCADQNFVKDQRLVIDVATDLSGVPSGKLVFWHRFDMETSWDGGVLEYSINAGATWVDILAGTASIPANPNRFIQGAYNGSLNSSSNPLGGRQAWTSSISGWEEVIVDLTDFADEMVLFRWRLGCDGSVSDVGWWVDDVDVLQGSECSTMPFEDGFESGDTSAWSATQP
jgi:hypothetical protein